MAIEGLLFPGTAKIPRADILPFRARASEKDLGTLFSELNETSRTCA